MVTPNFLRFSNTIELGLYRVITEIVNNTFENAEATKLSIEFKVTDKAITCNFNDNNGIGVGANTRGNVLGMKSMDAGVGMLGGNFELMQTEKRFRCLQYHCKHLATQISITSIIMVKVKPKGISGIPKVT